MSKTLSFEGKAFPLEQYESVLDCLLRNGQAIPYACKAGTCQACLVKTIDCDATPESQKWLKKDLRERGYTLACQWVPDADVAARLPRQEEFSIQVSIRALEPLNKRTLKLLLAVDDPGSMFPYRPGQYLSLINPEGITRSYSIANDFEQDGFLELHISETEYGLFTHWLFEQARVGDVLHIRGPAGDCYYRKDAEQDDFPMLLVGNGTGLAPLYGIARDALAQGHQGPISLFHGGRTPQDLYYVEELRALEQEHPNFHYYPSAMDEVPADETRIEQGSLQSRLEKTLDPAGLEHTRVYICGTPTTVHKLQKKIFLKGARSRNIFSDPFTERLVTSNASVKTSAASA